MRAFLDIMTDLGSVILAFGLLIYFGYFPGHEPETINGFGVGIVITFVLAVTYIALELIPVLRKETPDPLYLAWETFLSYTPLFAFCVIGTLWGAHMISLSFFQVIVGIMFLAAVLLDVLGILTFMAKQLFLTDEYMVTK